VSKDRRLGRGLAALLGTPEGEQAPSHDHPTPATHDTGPHRAASPATVAAEGAGTEPRAPQARDNDQHDHPPHDHAPSGDRPRSGHPPDGTSDMLHLDVHEIEENPFQPRRDFSETEIASLSESLKEHDMLQPILVRRIGERFQLISGERRWRAAIAAGWSTIPARVREADDRLVAELAIVENLQRKDLNPLEKALSFKRYLDEHGCKQDDLAQRLKIDRSTIANLMRLLELPEPVLDSLRRGDVTAGHARALLPLGEEEEQIDFCDCLIREGWSVRETERRVQEAIAMAEADDDILELPGKSKRTKAKPSDHVAALEQELRMTLGAKVEIRQSKTGRGRIVVNFSNHDEFDRIWRYLIDAPDELGRDVA